MRPVLYAALLTLTAIFETSLRTVELEWKRLFIESVRVDACLLELLPVERIVQAKKEPNFDGVLFAVTLRS